MEAKVEFKAERLICCDCRQPFIFSAGEKAYFFSKGLSRPRRCQGCRQVRKQTLVPDTEVRHDNH